MSNLTDMDLRLRVASPSKLLLALRMVVQRGWLPFGYGTLLTRLPSACWGGRSVLVETEVGEMVLPTKDLGTARFLLFGRLVHESGHANLLQSRENALVRALAGDSKVILDIGAHVGRYTRLMWAAMKENGSGAVVHAFEPNPTTFLYLAANSRDCPCVVTHRNVVGDSDEPVEFHCSKYSDLSSVRRQAGSPVLVSGTSVDSFCRSFDLTGRVDFVKVDVEGWELAVLRGATAVRSSDNPPIWMLEVKEEFLVEAGTSADQVTDEILSREGANCLYSITQEGAPRKLGHVSERGRANDVFIVPDSRIEQFMLAGTP